MPQYAVVQTAFPLLAIYKIGLVLIRLGDFLCLLTFNQVNKTYQTEEIITPREGCYVGQIYSLNLGGIYGIIKRS